MNCAMFDYFPSLCVEDVGNVLLRDYIYVLGVGGGVDQGLGVEFWGTILVEELSAIISREPNVL